MYKWHKQLFEKYHFLHRVNTLTCEADDEHSLHYHVACICGCISLDCQRVRVLSSQVLTHVLPYSIRNRHSPHLMHVMQCEQTYQAQSIQHAVCHFSFLLVATEQITHSSRAFLPHFGAARPAAGWCMSAQRCPHCLPPRRLSGPAGALQA